MVSIALLNPLYSSTNVLYTDGILIGVGVGVGLGVAGITVGFTVSVAVGVVVGVVVLTGGLTHPMRNDNTIMTIKTNLTFFIPSPDSTIALFINNIIDLFSDSDLLERFIINALH